jgi:DNA-binding FadR family transcriptional regulator
MKTEFLSATLTDQVEEKIIQYIKDNNFTPGDSLPNELQFAEMMSISRNVVREAMSRLRMLGLVDSRTKRGIVVTEPPILKGFSKVLDPNLMSIQTIKDLMGMRIVMEVGLTDFIFSNLTDQNISEIERIIDRHELLGVHNLSVEDEMQFHVKIYEIAGNNFIIKFHELIHPLFVFSKQNYEKYFKPVNLKLIQENKIVSHAEIFEKLKNRDSEGYRKIIRMHLQPYWEFIYNF